MNLSEEDREQLMDAVDALAHQGARFAEMEKFEASSICLAGASIAMILACVNDTLEEIRDELSRMEGS